MMIIQQIGSYAGLAAVVGLAVLSALYFSQARDVKRLREWAGRAPERGPVSPPQNRVMARPVQPPPRQVVPQAPAASPPQVPLPPGAKPAATGVGPAVATGPYAATPAAARAAETAAGGEARPAASQNTVARRPPPQALPPRPAPPGLGGHFAREADLARQREEAERRQRELSGEGRGEEGEELEGEELEGEELEGEELEGGELEGEELEGEEVESEEVESQEFEAQGQDPQDQESTDLDPVDDDTHDEDGPERPAEPQVSLPAPPPPAPAMATRGPLPPRPAPPGPRPASPGGPILPPYERSRPGGGDWQSRASVAGKPALIVGAILVVVGVIAVGALQFTGGDDGPTEKPRQAASSPAVTGTGSKKAGPRKAAVDPSSVTVSVLNGTTVGGLAAQLGDRLEGQGFQLGNVTNNTDQQRAESVVLFAPGAEREAEEVGRRLKIDQREPVDPDSQTRAGDATVVVVTGADLNK